MERALAKPIMSCPRADLDGVRCALPILRTGAESGTAHHQLAISLTRTHKKLLDAVIAEPNRNP